MEWFDVITLWYTARIAVATNGVAAVCENTTLSSNNDAEEKKKWIDSIQSKDNESVVCLRGHLATWTSATKKKKKNETRDRHLAILYNEQRLFADTHTHTHAHCAPSCQSLACRHIPAWTMRDTRPQFGAHKWHNQLIPDGKGNLVILEKTKKKKKAQNKKALFHYGSKKKIIFWSWQHVMTRKKSDVRKLERRKIWLLQDPTTACTRQKHTLQCLQQR